METPEQLAERMGLRKRNAQETIVHVKQLVTAKNNRTFKRSKNFHYARVDGIMVRVAGKPPTGSVGQFNSKMGSKTRSRKGRVTTKPNGYAVFVPSYEHDIVMY